LARWPFRPRSACGDRRRDPVPTTRVSSNTVRWAST